MRDSFVLIFSRPRSAARRSVARRVSASLGFEQRVEHEDCRKMTSIVRTGTQIGGRTRSIRGTFSRFGRRRARGKGLFSGRGSEGSFAHRPKHD